MIGRADIEGSKSDVAMNAWPPQASYPCGNFSDTSWVKLIHPKGSIGRAFTVCIRTENQNQMSFCPFALRQVSVLTELILGHLRYILTDVPPQSNSPPDNVIGTDQDNSEKSSFYTDKRQHKVPPHPYYRLSKQTTGVVVFHWRQPESYLPPMLHLQCLFTKSN